MAITSFQLTSSAGGPNIPFTIGVGFKKGDVPGEPILNIASYQSNVKTRWNDGSAKMAILSGEIALAANTPASITVNNGTAPTGTNITAADIAAANPSASVQCGAIGTVNLSDLLATPFRTWISGPQMVECHYRAQVGTDASLSVWFHVRLYKSGRIWVRAIVENGLLGGVTVDKSYIPTVSIGGVQIYTNGGASLSHYSYARWMQEAWIGGDPQITPKHDSAYLMSTKLVPNYWKNNPNSAALDALQQTYAPMGHAGLSVDMGGTGFQEQIGLLPLWDALYVTSGDPRAFHACLAHSSAVNSYGIVWRDPNTNLLPKPTDWPTATISSPSVAAGTLIWEVNHHPSEGYLAYLMTGDYWHYETLLCQTSLLYLLRSTTNYEPGGGPGGNGTNRILTWQTRGTAWALRTLSQLCAIAPTGDAVAADYQTLLTNNIAHWNTVISGLGAQQTGDIFEYAQASTLNGYGAPGLIAPWQQHFWAQSMGLGSDIEPLASMTGFNAVRDWIYKFPVGMLGDANGFNFAYASDYNVYINNDTDPTPSTFYSDWAQVWAATHPATAHTNTLQGVSAGQPSSAATGYWGNILPAIAYAVSHGAAGAQAAWNRLTAATNWTTVENSGFNDVPIWGVVPRARATVALPVNDYYSAPIGSIIRAGRFPSPPSSGLPTWVSNLPLWQWYGIPNTALSSVAPNPASMGAPSAKITSWQGAALKRAGSIYMLGPAGGHADYAGNEVDAIALNTENPQWVQLSAPSPNSQLLNESQFYLDLKPAATHTFYASQFLESRNKYVVIRSPGLLMSGVPAAPAGWAYGGFTGTGEFNFSFDMATNSWEAPETIAKFTWTGDYTAAMVVKHQHTDDIYYAPLNGGFYKLSASTLQWTKINNNYDTNYCASAMDPTRNRILVTSNYDGTYGPRFRGLDGSYDYGQTYGGLGANAFKVPSYSGMVYDEVNDTFLLFANDATTNAIQTVRMTAGTLVIDKPTITGTLPAQRPNNVNGSVQYVPELGGVVMANSYTGNVLFMRTALL